MYCPCKYITIIIIQLSCSNYCLSNIMIKDQENLFLIIICRHVLKLWKQYFFKSCAVNFCFQVNTKCRQTCNIQKAGICSFFNEDFLQWMLPLHQKLFLIIFFHGQKSFLLAVCRMQIDTNCLSKLSDTQHPVRWYHHFAVLHGDNYPLTRLRICVLFDQV